MKLLKLLIVLLAWLLITSFNSHLHAQDSPPKLSPDKGTITNQFDYVIRQSDVIEDSRLVKTWWLTRLKSHVADSIKDLKSDLRTTQKIVKTKDLKMDSLKLVAEDLNKSLNISRSEKNSIRFLGIPMSKQAYKSIVWMIIFTLSVFLLVFIILFKRSNVVTNQTKSTLAELKEEFENHRKTAREREEKLVTDYHRELKKLKEKKTV